MDTTKVRKIVRRDLRFMVSALYLNDWEINCAYRSLDGDTSAECTPDPLYRKATIVFDPTKQENKAELLRVMRHELFHIVLAEFQTFRRSARASMCPSFYPVIDEAYDRADEGTIGTLERIFFNRGLTPEKLIEDGKKEMDAWDSRKKKKREKGRSKKGSTGK